MRQPILPIDRQGGPWADGPTSVKEPRRPMPCRSGASAQGICSIEVMLPNSCGRRKVFIAAGFVLGLAASGCGGSAQARPQPTATGPTPSAASSAASSTGPVKVVATNTVSIKNFAFSPATITVKPDTTVTWVNHDEDAHTVTFQSNPKVA